MTKAGEAIKEGRLKSNKAEGTVPAGETAEHKAFNKGSKEESTPTTVGGVTAPSANNKKARRAIVKAAEEEEKIAQGKIVIQAAEDLKRGNLLSRKEKRAAMKTIKEAAEESDREEEEKKSMQIAEEKKQAGIKKLKAGNLSGKKIRAVEKIIADAAGEKRMLRNKKRVREQTAKHVSTSALTPHAPVGKNDGEDGEEEEVYSEMSKKKIKMERNKVEKALKKPEMANEQRWLKFRKGSMAEAKRNETRIKILETAILKHDRNNEGEKLQRVKRWRKKAVAAKEARTAQDQKTEENYASTVYGRGVISESTLLSGLLAQQKQIIDYVRGTAKKTKRDSSDEDKEDPGDWEEGSPTGMTRSRRIRTTKSQAAIVSATNKYEVRNTTQEQGSTGFSEMRTIAQKLEEDLRKAEENISRSEMATLSTAAMWATPFRATEGYKRPNEDHQSTLHDGRLAYNGQKQPVKLEALSLFKVNEKIDPMQWFKAAKVKLKNQESLGQLFSEKGAIAAIMDRTEVGSSVATWFNAQTNPEVISSMATFEAAFTRRFASGKTVEAAMERLSQIRTTSFADLDLFYAEFCDLMAIVGVQRSKPDLVRNFLDALPKFMRTFIMVRNPGIRNTAHVAIDELFTLAKEIAAAEGMGSAAKQHTVMVTELQELQELSGERAHWEQQAEVFPVTTSGRNEDTPSKCWNCNSTSHQSRLCDKPRRCFHCGQTGHVKYNCPGLMNPRNERNDAPTNANSRDFNKGDERGQFERGFPNHRPNTERPNNERPNNSLDRRPYAFGGSPNWRTQQGRANVNMVEPVEYYGARSKVKIINVGEAANIPDELHLAFSELGLNLLSSEASAVTGASRLSDNQTGKKPDKLKLLERVQLDTTSTSNVTGRRIAIDALIDTGAEVSCINQKLADELGIDTQTKSRSVRISGAGGITTAITIPELTLHVRNFSLKIDLLMLPLGTTSMILGLDVLSALGASITCSPLGVEFNPNHSLSWGKDQNDGTGRAKDVMNQQPAKMKESHQREEQETIPKEVWAVGPMTEDINYSETAGWADHSERFKGVPEACHYSDNENFHYASEATPQISEEELLKKLKKDFAWFEEHKEAHAAAIALIMELIAVYSQVVWMSASR